MVRVLCVLALAAAPMVAQTAVGERLSLAAVVQEAIERNPEIRAAQKRFEAALQRARGEGALPDPMIGLGWNSSGAPWPGAGLGREPVANIGVMVTQPIPYPGKLGLRVQMANKEAQAEWESYQAAQLAVLSRLKQAFYRLQHVYAMQDVLARNATVLTRMLKVTETRYSVGKAMQQEILRAQTQLSVLETQRLQFDSRRRIAEAELNAALNRAPGTPVPPPVEAELHETLPPFEEILNFARDNAPMLVRDQRMIERSEAAVNSARRDWYPDLAVTAGYYNMGAMPSMYMFRLDASVPIRGRKQRAAVTEQSYALSAARRTYEATQQTLAAKLREDYEMAQTALSLLNVYSNTLLPQSNLAVESGLATYQAGTADFMPVLQNFMSSVEYEMSYHAQMENFHMALARLEEMSGMELTHISGKAPPAVAMAATQSGGAE
ncbi:MAG TPA: TolC family protein [Bryobacteraceae bacterium]|nr:TolC family protein [Bryobacteraceae bacterium]